MNKVISRLLVFALGIPLIIFLIWLPFFNHLALHILIAVFTILASLEMYNMFSKKHELLPKPFVVTASVLIPLSGLVYSLVEYFVGKKFAIGAEIYTYTLIAMVLIIMFTELLTAKTFEGSNSRIAFSTFIVLYSGYLMSFISRITYFSKPVAEQIVDEVSKNNILADNTLTTPLLACFCLMVFLCDSLAWFFGVLLGKTNKGFVKASPNKSIAGFCGGFVGSVLGGLIAYFVWPDVFTGSVAKIIVIGLIIAFSSIIGDLIESIFKRSADVKDSGNVIPGRGGALDSIDSLLASAPVFYLLLSLFYNL